jgi:NTE family protein
MPQKQIGLSLSGGGLKGFSQIAVLQDLEKHNIEIATLAGTSMGSIIAALVASGYDGQSLEERALELERRLEEQRIFKVGPNVRNLIGLRSRVDGIISQSLFEDFCSQFFREDGLTFLSDVKKPLAITAVDIDSGKLFVFTNHRESFREDPSWAFYPEDIKLGTAVAASCAYPLVFSTASIGEHRMADGGVLLNSPVRLMKKEGLNGILSVTMIETDYEPLPRDAIKVAFRSLNLLMTELSQAQNEAADIVVNFPFPQEETFNIGGGANIINTSKAMLKSNPIDYSPLIRTKWRSLFRGLFAKKTSNDN